MVHAADGVLVEGELRVSHGAELIVGLELSIFEWD
jgi:hypothetical protein